MSSIDPTVKTSRVFDALLSLHDRLSETAFPASLSGEGPTLCFHAVPIDRAGEFVAVLVDDEASAAEWIQAGPASQEERFVINVVVMSHLPSVHDGRDVVTRLEALADVVQGVLWDAAGNKPKAIGFANERRIGRTESVIPVVYDLGDGALVGEAVVRIACTAQL